MSRSISSTWCVAFMFGRAGELLTRQREISLDNGEQSQVAREADCHPTIQRLWSIVTHSIGGGAFRDN